MSAVQELDSDDFKIVSYKRKTVKTHSYNHPGVSFNSESSEKFNFKSAIGRIEAAKEDLLVSDVYSSLLASLREGLKILQTSTIKEIVCFGLGRIGECMIARYQLALLLCLRDIYDVNVFVYDPIFNENDCNILNTYQFTVLSNNLEGKYPVEQNNTTLFYLPHCPKQLSNNLLWKNWGLQLSSCIIIANSFTKILESHTKRDIIKHAEFILKSSPYLSELAVINSFKYYDIFNDTAIHIFALERLALISQDFWDSRDEPQYSDDDLEFVTNNLNDKLKL